MNTTPLVSMTGFGSAVAAVEGWRVGVEFRSVNQRGLQVRVMSPDSLRWLEPHILERVKGSVERGRIEVRIDLEPAQDDGSADFRQIDQDRFAALARTLKKLALDNRLATPISLHSLWEYRSFFERSIGDEFSEDSADLILPAVDEALAEMIESRRREGRGIAEDLTEHLGQLEKCLNGVDELRTSGQQALRTRAEQRLREALAEFEVETVDEGRLVQEIAYYVEKGDISEELQRARSHVEKLSGLVADTGSDGVGKKIDFYLQEMIRETNTMGSKSQHAGLTDLVIEMKSLVEKMREQAANVE